MNRSDAASLERRIAAWLAHRIGVGAIEVEGLARIPGGASRETYRFLARWEIEGTLAERNLILRRDPPSSLIETRRSREFAALKAFHGSAVPVPDVLYIEEDSAWLERPFFVMEEIAGGLTDGRLFETPAFAAVKAEIGRQKWTILGRIAAANPAALRLVGPLEPCGLDRIWSRELDYWEAVIDADALTPQPIGRAAIRWLRRYPPPPAQRLVVVHGDYRTGNFLFDVGGGIRGILDWEMCHLGDPLEDVAWALNPLWAGADPGRPGRLIPRADALALWQTSSGLAIDVAALHWWEIFAMVKGLAIWLSAAKELAEGRSGELILALAGWLATSEQDHFLLQAMGHAA